MADQENTMNGVEEGMEEAMSSGIAGAAEAANTAYEAAESVSEAAAGTAGAVAEASQAAAAAVAGAAASAGYTSQAGSVAGAAEIASENFTENEKKQISDYAKTIDITDTKTIIGYGAGVQKQMADFSESVLDSVKTHDLGEVGDMLAGVITDLKDFNPDEKEKGGLFGLFKKQGNKISELKAGYEKASANVEKVADALKQHQIKLLKDVDMLDQMYAANLKYYKQLSMYIAAGKEKIEQARNVDLAAAKARAEASGLAEDAQAAKDLEDQITRFEKKIHDLELTRAVALQTAPQIRMIQNNDTIMVEKIQSTIVNTIPLWKNQMVLTLGLNDSLQAAKAEQDVTNMTNQLLLSNAEKLKQTTIETAKASERGIVDLETLKKTNESLITTLDEVTKIQTEGRQKRAEAERELRVMEDELKRKLLSMTPGYKEESPAETAAEPAPEDPFAADDFNPFA